MRTLRCGDCGCLAGPDYLSPALSAGGRCEACERWRERHGPPADDGADAALWTCRWTKAERGRLAELAAAGVRQATIARELGKSGKAVSRALRRAGLGSASGRRKAG